MLRECFLIEGSIRATCCALRPWWSFTRRDLRKDKWLKHKVKASRSGLDGAASPLSAPLLATLGVVVNLSDDSVGVLLGYGGLLFVLALPRVSEAWFPVNSQGVHYNFPRCPSHGKWIRFGAPERRWLELRVEARSGYASNTCWTESQKAKDGVWYAVMAVRR